MQVLYKLPVIDAIISATARFAKGGIRDGAAEGRQRCKPGPLSYEGVSGSAAQARPMRRGIFRGRAASAAKSTQFESEALFAVTVHVVVGLDVYVLQSLRNSDPSQAPCEGLFVHVRMEKHAAADLLALGGQHTPMVGVVVPAAVCVTQRCVYRASILGTDGCGVQHRNFSRPQCQRQQP